MPKRREPDCAVLWFDAADTRGVPGGVRPVWRFGAFVREVVELFRMCTHVEVAGCLCTNGPTSEIPFLAWSITVVGCHVYTNTFVETSTLIAL